MNKKGDIKFSFIEIVLILFVVLLLIGAAYRFYWVPLKSTATPIVANLGDEASKIGQLDQERDVDKDRIADNMDKCCECGRQGAEGVATTGEDIGCASGQAKTEQCPLTCIT